MFYHWTSTTVPSSAHETITHYRTDNTMQVLITIKYSIVAGAVIEVCSIDVVIRKALKGGSVRCTIESC